MKRAEHKRNRKYIKREIHRRHDKMGIISIYTTSKVMAWVVHEAVWVFLIH